MGCCNREPCDSKKEALPTAAFSTASFTALVPKLMEVLKTGICLWSFKDAAADQLAASIAAMVRENENLKALLKVFCAPSPSIVPMADIVAISFGPANTYTLHISAATPAEKDALADSLQKAADTLRGATQNKQLQFDWDLQ